MVNYWLLLLMIFIYVASCVFVHNVHFHKGMNDIRV